MGLGGFREGVQVKGLSLQLTDFGGKRKHFSDKFYCLWQVHLV